jgi:hypothetical protein
MSDQQSLVEKVTVSRSTSGRLEDDWECEGEIVWSEKKGSFLIRVFKNGGTLEGQHPIDTTNSYISKWIKVQEFLQLNPSWSQLVKKVVALHVAHSH